MAFGVIGAVGIASDVNNVTSYTATTANSAIATGDFILLISVADNISAVDGNNNEHTSITGGTGTWTKLGEYTNSNAGAGNGCTVSLWYFESTGTNSIGTVFTLNFSSAVIEKCCAMRAFTKTSTAKVALSLEPGTNPITSQVDAASDFGSSAFAGLTSKERLYVRALGKEANVVTQITVSASFTAYQVNRSQNAGSAVLLRGEWRINTSTGETSSPTLAAVGDTAGLFFALVEQVSASYTQTMDPIALTATAQVPIKASFNKTMDPIVLTATGGFLWVPSFTVTVPVEARSVGVAVETRSTSVAVESRSVTVPLEA